MKVVLHYSSADQAPIGIWWVPEGQHYPMSKYTGLNAWRVRGAQTMAMKNSNMTWDEYFDYLQDLSSPLQLWETAEVKTWDPRQYLEYARKKTRRFI